MHLVLLTEVTHHLIRRVKHLTQVGEEPKMSTIKGKNNEISTRIRALPQCALTQLTSMSVQSHMSRAFLYMVEFGSVIFVDIFFNG